MALSVAPHYTALLGFLLVYLSIWVIRRRRRLKVAIGAGGEAAIERAARVQTNFSECVPMVLILLLAEIQGGSPLVLHAIGLALVVGRAAHAFGVSQAAEDHRWRTLGMTLTFFAIIGGGIANLTGWAS